MKLMTDIYNVMNDLRLEALDSGDADRAATFRAAMTARSESSLRLALAPLTSREVDLCVHYAQDGAAWQRLLHGERLPRDGGRPLLDPKRKSISEAEHRRVVRSVLPRTHGETAAKESLGGRNQGVAHGRGVHDLVESALLESTTRQVATIHATLSAVAQFAMSESCATLPMLAECVLGTENDRLLLDRAREALLVLRARILSIREHR